MILITSEVLFAYFDTCAYDLLGMVGLLMGLMFLKYLEIWLISFCNLAGIRGCIFSMLDKVVLSDVLLLQLEVGMILKVSLAEIFSLRDLVFLSAIRESYLD